jgi:hypothetical protein
MAKQGMYVRVNLHALLDICYLHLSVLEKFENRWD